MVCLWERCHFRCASPARDASNSMVRPRKRAKEIYLVAQEQASFRARFGRYNFPNHNWEMQNFV